MKEEREIELVHHSVYRLGAHQSLSAVQMVWYGMVWYGMVWYGVVWYGMAQLIHPFSSSVF